MNDTIKLILSLSLSGSMLAVLIFAAKPFIKNRLSKSIQYYVWLVVLVRLLFPFSFEGSLMNYVFNSHTAPVTISSQNAVNPVSGISENNVSSAIPVNVKRNVAEGVYDNDTDHSKYLKDLLNQYSLDLWLLGVIIVVAANLIGYARFLNYLRKSNTPASDEQKELLNTLPNGRLKVRLVRNHFVTTPMLIGILRPCIIIPDSDYTSVQLKNILLHEVSHLKRFDIVIKWLAMVAAAIHWFNPLMYLIRREIDHACELACDEAVIKNLTPAEKQVYGDTLISVAAEHRYPLGVIQVTMSEEKKSLKERLLAIMNHTKKSRFIIAMSALMLAAAVLGAAMLGASVRTVNDKPPRIYINAEDDKTKEALTGSYTWKYLNMTVNADSDNPVNFKYGSDNIVNVAAGQKLIISTQKIKLDKKYDFTIKQISVYKDSKPVKLETAKPSFLDKNLYLQAPLDAGEYTYCLILDFKDRGTVSYGFAAKVALYDLTGIAKYRTPYVGNNSKVLAITGLLPVPDHSFKQQYISLQTEAQPYGITAYYEAVSNKQYQGEWPIDITKSPMKSALEKNALVLFCMIDNLDKVTFAFRNSPSEGDLDTSKYDSAITFLRTDITKKYGDLSSFSKNLDSLYKALEDSAASPQSLNEAVSQAVRSQQKSYLAGETATEGHIILDTEEKDGIVKVYTVSSFGAFGFENGIFTKISGSGAIPTVLTFSKDKDGNYSLLDYKEPMDGAYFIKSTKKMFPSQLWNEVLNTDKYTDLAKQQEKQAAEYLQSIGKKAQVSANYVERKLVNINVEASNKLFAELAKDNEFLRYCPYWLGTKEQIENGARYVYETSQSKSTDGYDLITFSKKKADGSIVQEAKYKIIGNEPVPIN